MTKIKKFLCPLSLAVEGIAVFLLFLGGTKRKNRSNYLVGANRKKEKNTPFPPPLSPYNPLSLTPYPPEKKEKERARWGRRRRIGRLYLGERW
nr:MAG TPA: hypothetical protein [Caudoviricetes sp.]